MIKRAETPHLVKRKRMYSKFPNRDNRTVKSKRWDYRINTMPMGKPCINHRGAFINATPKRSNNFVYQIKNLRIVLIAGGLALMVPESITDVIGIAIIVAVFVIQYGMARKGKTGKEPPTDE